MTVRFGAAPKLAPPSKRLPALRAAWLPLTVATPEGGSGWNGAIKSAFDKRSGVYVVRDRPSGSVLYVGESHTGRGWKTLLRHFQDPSGKFAKVSEWTHAQPGRLDVAIFVTEKGQAALDLQAKAIAKWKPSKNLDDGQAEDRGYPVDWDLDDAPKKNPAGRDVFREVQAKIAAQKAAIARYLETYGERPYQTTGRGGVALMVSRDPSKPSRYRVTRFEGNDPIGHIEAETFAEAMRTACSLGGTVPKVNPRTSKAKKNPGAGVSIAARKEYKRSHWGEAGEVDFEVGEAADPGHGELVKLGDLREITYGTIKGGDGDDTDYVHEFGINEDTGKPRGKLPILAYHVCPSKTCKSRGKLVVVGGSYRVTERGIVG